jgi:murein DD-endopeptidase MepM/ murein hydrolase activator NlpD
MFKWPCEGKITSRFGRDMLNGVARIHNGVDIAQSGMVTVKASAAGTVSKSYRSSSYGEVVFIVHNIGGKQYETVYAHMREGSRKVGVGDRVSQGQALGLMGDTGYSFGQHLHFELHVGRWNINKTDAVDPLKYLGKEVVNNAKTHTIKSGDTLWELSKQYGVSVADIERLNPSVNPRALQIGDKIKLSGSASDPFAGKKLVCDVAKLRFYSKASWSDRYVAGHLTKGIGFPTIVRKLKVDDAYQYEVKNSKGAIYYVTANGKYVDIK